MTRSSLLKREAAEYMARTEMTPTERGDLLDWIKEGHRVYENPWYISEEDGHPMDYISAMRATDELWVRPKPDNDQDITEEHNEESF